MGTSDKAMLYSSLNDKTELKGENVMLQTYFVIQDLLPSF